jgi:hypothetical protein
MKKVIRLTESDLLRIVRKAITETDKQKVIQGIIRGQQGKPQYGYGDSESNEDISYDIKSVKCDENGMEGHVDIDGDDTIIIRYCKGDSEELGYLKRKGKKLLHSKHGLS